MTILVPIAMFGWIPIVLCLFAMVTPRRAVIASFIVGWLFLPNAVYKIEGLPDVTKMSITVIAVLIGVVVVDPSRLIRLRLRWYDLPVCVLCLSVMVSSIANGLGLYEGISATLANVVTWGLPYLIGRAYFNTSRALRDLAVGIFLGGLIYMPLCLWEIRMSPHLHSTLYGFTTRPFFMSVRYGGFRPTVFMWTYLPVAHWMTMATVAGFWLWKGARMRCILGIPTVVLLLGMLVTLVLCKMAVVAVLLPIGVLFPLLMARMRTSLPLVVLTLMIPSYMLVRATGLWLGQELVIAAEIVDKDRAHSLEGRIVNENRLAAKALQRPFFGWGRFGRWRVFNDEGKDITLSDGLWIITLGTQGIIGLVALSAIYVVPLLRFVSGYPGAVWAQPEVAPAASIAMIILVTFVYNLPNATTNPVIAAAIGGLASLDQGSAPIAHTAK